MKGRCAIDREEVGLDQRLGQEVARWLKEEDAISDPEGLHVERVGGGRSMKTLRIQLGQRAVIVRYAPARSGGSGAHDIGREERVLRALEPSAVPTPKVLGVLECGTLDTPVLILQEMQGSVVEDAMKSRMKAEVRAGFPYAVAEHLVANLREIHRTDLAAVGLRGFGRPEGFIERQITRWQSQQDRLLRADGLLRCLPGQWDAVTRALDSVAAWLREHAPSESRATLLHGDYGLHNVLIEPIPTPRISAVLDWEMASIGDPYTDVGWLASTWPGPDALATNFDSKPPFANIPCPNGRDLIQAYADATESDGVPSAPWSFYLVLARWKRLGILMRQCERVLAGVHDDERFGDFGVSIQGLIDGINEEQSAS